MIDPKAHTRPKFKIGTKRLIDNSFQLSLLQILQHVWLRDEGQDIAEYAVMLAVILVVVIGAIRLIGGNANNAFSSVASELQ